MGHDIREQLRRDREEVLAGLEALGTVGIDRACALERLAELRRCWKVHVLTREAVVYRALEGADGTATTVEDAEARLVENKAVNAMFDKLSLTRPGSLTWHARLDVVRQAIQRHLENESGLGLRLESRLSIEALRDLSEQYQLVREKLAVLEEAKAA